MLIRLHCTTRSAKFAFGNTKVAGLYFVITANASKSFYFVKRIEGKPGRIRIGGFPDINIDEARKEAQRFNGEIAKGENPHADRRNKTNVPTLKELFDYWLTTHAKIHKKSWAADVYLFNKHYTALHNKTLTQLQNRTSSNGIRNSAKNTVNIRRTESIA